MNKIKELRKEKNITVAELAKELGISQSMLTNYENGNGTPRDESIWEKLSQIFGVSKSHVMGLTTDIETANKTKQLKVVVDTSQPISIQPKNQTDLDVSSFDVDSSGGDGSLNPNSTYNDWKWILVRTNGGQWQHVDHGY